MHFGEPLQSLAYVGQLLFVGWLFYTRLSARITIPAQRFSSKAKLRALCHSDPGGTRTLWILKIPRLIAKVSLGGGRSDGDAQFALTCTPVPAPANNATTTLYARLAPVSGVFCRESKVPLLSGSTRETGSEREIISSERDSLVEDLCGISPKIGEINRF